jgi:hypothetical protein
MAQRDAATPRADATAPVRLLAGVSHADGVTIARCFQTHSLEMLAVGVPLATLASMNSCAAGDYVQPAPVVAVRSQTTPVAADAAQTSGAVRKAASRALAAAACVCMAALLAV